MSAGYSPARRGSDYESKTVSGPRRVPAGLETHSFGNAGSPFLSILRRSCHFRYRSPEVVFPPGQAGPEARLSRVARADSTGCRLGRRPASRSEEHTSELP